MHAVSYVCDCHSLGKSHKLGILYANYVCTILCMMERLIQTCENTEIRMRVVKGVEKTKALKIS